jgi:hypothetical protein
MFNRGSQVPAAEEFLSNITVVQETLANNIRRAKEIQKNYYDHHTREAPVYKAGDWVWLLRRNITTSCPSSKLDFKQLGSFCVDLPLGNDVYCLVLPKDLSCLHPVFHTSLLPPLC